MKKESETESEGWREEKEAKTGQAPKQTFTRPILPFHRQSRRRRHYQCDQMVYPKFFDIYYNENLPKEHSVLRKYLL